MFNFSGNFEKCVTLLRDKHKSKDLAPVVQSIFSHASVARKNQLTIMLIVSTCSKVIFLLSFDSIAVKSIAIWSKHKFVEWKETLLFFVTKNYLELCFQCT